MIEYVGQRAPTIDEREQFQFATDIVLFEWRILGTDQVAYVPIERRVIDKFGEDKIKAESWPRIRRAFERLSSTQGSRK